MKRCPISVVIPIKNEAANLPRCLAAVRWADEIWVVDSRSTDGSQAIAEATGAKVVQFEFNGTWPKKKNWALENLPFKHDWVFILDADEVLPPEAEAEFRAIVGRASRLADGSYSWSDRTKSSPGPITNDLASPHGPGDEIAGYWINRRFMFMGKWLKHAYYPNWNLRLFRHRVGRYEKLTETETASGDNEVHEHVIVQGGTGRLACEMDHHAFPDIATFVEKHNRYSNWEARVAAERSLQGSAAGLQSGQVGLRRRLKALSHRLPFRPTLRFLYVYVVQRGFLDGAEGYYFARLHAFYEFLCVVKEMELKRTRRQT
jgi:glycosyltransferase involved in cell wall biosynthesis